MSIAASDTVTAGSTVTVDDGLEHTTYEIVSSLESDAFRGRLSERSPLGCALMGRGPGEEIRFWTPGGLRSVTIISVSSSG